MNDERQLIDGYLDGELTRDDESRLAEWLAADGEHVRQFVREIQSDDASVKVPPGYYAVAVDGTELTAQPFTGSILREYWTNVLGEYFVTFLTSHPDFPDHPSGREYLKKFEGPSHWGKNYGARIRGYLHPPLTGAYTFWIASSDGGEFFLSPDDDPESKVQIGYANGTVLQDWRKARGQQPSAITVVVGRK